MPWVSHALRADDHGGIAHGLKMVAERDSEWAGIPMPLSGERLCIEPKYPRAEALMEIGAPELADVPQKRTLVNSFWSWRWRTTIAIWMEDGKRKFGPMDGSSNAGLLIKTMGVSDAWSIDSEMTAMNTLSTLVSERQMRQYFLTGTFLETSKRSGVIYMFRRLRPTLALTTKKHDQVTVLCALCLHPIAFYLDSWAGAMVPTDDVIAHLMLMRGDEHMFWKRANQHPAFRKEAGI